MNNIDFEMDMPDDQTTTVKAGEVPQGFNVTGASGLAPQSSNARSPWPTLLVSLAALIALSYLGWFAAQKIVEERS